MKYIQWVLIGFLVFLFMLLGVIILQSYEECKSKGGEMVGSGRYHTSYIYVNNVLVPMNTEEQECSK